MFHDWADEVVALGDAVGVHDFGCTPFAGAPVEDFALHDELMHGPNRLFHRRHLVRPVAHVNVQIVHLQPAQRGLTGFDDVLAVQSTLGGKFAARTEEDF